ncbi:PREDICTED: 26S proteasome non-ATPase regulatory subunit 2-like isoform X2 [Vollenhovia emeryi]|uniref:26S proteasome non-ATPase regulatory subunit 2-like isoform X2 n=1 Tax=Vollenhovia emeryi TaxID=411798 RepID=UPI0005F4597A|nr:PREDICTED: 26S proteasome non-ATPase regulatory subunit 2-like isoform X2 [Vollenhovia emeryi]
MNKPKQDKESDMNEEDKRLQEELLQAVDVLQGKDETAVVLSLNHLRMLIRTSTTSMTSVPKPLKYLRNFYPSLRSAYRKLKREEAKIRFAEILSILALAGATPGSRDCLDFCIKGAVDNPGEWGHEYVRQLEAEIVDEWTNAPIKEEHKIRKRLTSLIKSIIAFDMRHNAEIQACDLCLEIDELNFLAEYLEPTNFIRVCHYLISCAGYSEDMERRQILEFATEQYLKFNECTRALFVALQLANSELVFKCFTACHDPLTRNQLAFILARLQDQPLRTEYHGNDVKDIEAILSNGHVNTHFQILARELDILEPKLPEDIYKSWLVNGFKQVEHDSARANLAASFVSGFVHAGFGQDKLMANTSDCWVYKNKEHGMLSATASLGLIHMWDVDGGLIPIDKYLYTNEDYVKSGALLAIGLVNCGIRNECDPALALLSEYVKSNSQILRIGAIMGLGLAYAGSRRKDVTELLSGALTDEQNNIQVLSLIAISLGLINVGSGDSDVSSAILMKLLGLSMKELVVTHSRFLALALGMIYMGTRDAVETLSVALEALPEPYSFASQTMLQICAYAGTGDVLIVQELLRICSEAIEEVTSAKTTPESTSIPSCCDQRRPQSSSTKLEKNIKNDKQTEESAKDIGTPQAIASLGVGVVGLGEGKENSRIFGQIGRYGSTPARRAMPLALALSSLSNADPAVLDVLNKYSHDHDADVALNAILALGLVGAGTNNARLATMLRQLAAYHAKNPSHLFLVRISQGLVHLGKGTLSLSPLRYASKVLDYTALAGLMVVLVACLDCRNLILSQSHYLMYCLAIAMEPRWLVTVDENLKNLPVSVRIGQSVDVVGKAGNPKSIVGGQVQTTPVLLGAGEKAELVSDQYEPLSSVLEGFVILREKTAAS